MSDITKKIFSIEQADDLPATENFTKSNIIPPVPTEPAERIIKPKVDDVPEFVTRDSVRPRLAPPTHSIETLQPPKAGGWLILGFGLLYIIGAGLYFGLPLLNQPVGLIPIAGLAVLLCLPLILLFLLWRAFRHLSFISFENSKLAQATEILVSPDAEALKRTETLSSGIRNEISKINSGLAKTVEAFQGVQIAIAKESQALDTAGLALTNRSDDVGRNLTLQREAIQGMSETVETRMSLLSSQISDTGATLDGICTTAEAKLLKAGEALQKASVTVNETMTSTGSHIEEKITAIEATSQNLKDTTGGLTTSITASTESLQNADSTFANNVGKLQTLNAQTQTQISDLQATIGHGYEVLAELREAAESREAVVASHYDGLTAQIKKSEDDTLAAQGQTARMVETNLAQMRRDFSRMETDLKALQSKLNNLRKTSDDLDDANIKPARLNLVPLESDFPPVEPSRPIARPSRSKFKPEFEPISDSPLNLGVDMEIESQDQTLINFEPDLIRRPGELETKSKPKGFGRRKDKDEKSGWRWRDMLGTLERPDDNLGRTAPPLGEIDRKVNAVALLTGLQLSPAAIVDEGTVVDATQGQINKGEPGLTAAVVLKLPEAVSHLKDSLNRDVALKANLRSFTLGFAKTLSHTTQTAPALRAALGSPEGRAYLLCAAAFRPELRG